MEMKIEVGIPTKDRYPNLAMLLWSLTEQSFKNFTIKIVDDSENRQDIRELSYILPILKRMDSEGLAWSVIFGPKRGPHHCHQLVLDETKRSYVFRVDDDSCLDKYALEKLVNTWEELESKGVKVGAVGSVIVDPSMPIEYRFLPVGFRSFRKFQGKVENTGWNTGDQQWRMHPDTEIQAVEHLYSSFLYSVEAGRKIGGYELSYNVVGHREETDFTYRMFKSGYGTYIQPEALIWHLRNPSGGIRTYESGALWAECQERFMSKFKFKRGKNQDRVVKVFGGLGDHLCATPMLRALKRKGEKVVVTSVYPYLLQGNPNIDELIYPTEEVDYEKIDFRDLYKWCFETGFEGCVSEAWCNMYEVDYDGDNLDYAVYPLERVWVNRNIKDKKFILISVSGGIPVVQYADITLVGAAKRRTQVKDWFKPRWEVLVSEIKSLGYKVYQVGGQDDEKVEGCDRYFLGIDYRLTIAMLEKSRGFVSVDTFLGHAGHAIGKKGVVIFGPSEPKFFGHNSNINIFHREGCPQGRACLQGSEPKFQWLSHGYTCENRKCMESISVEEVLQEVRKLDNSD